jgi:hypothetical protein
MGKPTGLPSIGFRSHVFRFHHVGLPTMTRVPHIWGNRPSSPYGINSYKTALYVTCRQAGINYRLREQTIRQLPGRSAIQFPHHRRFSGALVAA